MKRNSGFIAILMLLIGVTILIFLAVQNLTSLKPSADYSATTTETGSGLAPMNAAQNAKNLIEQNSRRADKELE